MSNTYTLCTLIVSAVVVLAVPSSAQVTSDSLTIGGPGAVGCQDPSWTPVLTGGIPASADLDFTFDSSTGQLDLTVTNTSPVTVGVPNPVITQLYFNLPQGSITGISLTGQVGASGPTPAFTASFDLDPTDGLGQIQANCTGAFGAALSKPGGGPSGAIGNALADTLPGQVQNIVFGPVTFTFQVSALNLEGLTAAAFARSFSVIGTPWQVNAAAKFQGGGPGAAESGTITSDATDCGAAGWIIGSPNVGSTVFLAQSGAPGCSGCVVASLSSGPAVTVAGLTIPLGDPLSIVSSAVQPPVTVSLTPLVIPNIPGIEGITVYFAVLLVDLGASPFTFSVGDQFQLTILP